MLPSRRGLVGTAAAAVVPVDRHEYQQGPSCQAPRPGSAPRAATGTAAAAAASNVPLHCQRVCGREPLRGQQDRLRCGLRAVGLISRALPLRERGRKVFVVYMNLSVDAFSFTAHGL